jgi:nucleoside-diphosphate-sugar epimerase
MNVLVTGATSMIGRVTVEALLARGDVVTTMQRSPSGFSTTEISGSVTDVNATAHACAGQDAVIHLAAKVDIVGEWDDFVSVNVEGTNNMLAAAREAGVSRFVYVSSPSVAHGGESIVGEGAEPADPERTRGDYATSKAMAEQLAISTSTPEFAVVAVRPHLVIGPGDTQLVGRIVERAREGRMPLIGSGLALVDTTWVDNAADALVAALDRAPQVEGQSFVVSNGEPRTVHELIARITAAAGVPWSPRSIPRRAAILGGAVAERLWESTGRDGEPAMTAFGAEQLSTAHWFDLRTTREALDWEPRVSLSEGFELLAASFDNHHSS